MIVLKNKKLTAFDLIIEVAVVVTVCIIARLTILQLRNTADQNRYKAYRERVFKTGAAIYNIQRDDSFFFDKYRIKIALDNGPDWETEMSHKKTENYKIGDRVCVQFQWTESNTMDNIDFCRRLKE